MLGYHQLHPRPLDIGGRDSSLGQGPPANDTLQMYRRTESELGDDEGVLG